MLSAKFTQVKSTPFAPLIVRPVITTVEPLATDNMQVILTLVHVEQIAQLAAPVQLTNVPENHCLLHRHYARKTLRRVILS